MIIEKKRNRKIKRKESRIRRIVDSKNKSDLITYARGNRRRVGLFVKEGFANEKENTLGEKIINVIKPTVHQVYRE